MSHTYPEAFPSISMDIELGEHANLVDVNMWHIVDRLAAGGLSPEEINSLSLHLSAKDNLGSASEDRTTSGTFNRETRTITLARPNGIGEEHRETTNSNAASADMLLRSFEYSDTLEHELEHVVAGKDTELQKQQKSYLRRVAGKRILRSSPFIYASSALSGLAVEHNMYIDHAYSIGIAVGIGAIALKKTLLRRKVADLEFKEYLNSPEEQRARRAGENAPHSLVLSVPKEMPITFED